MAAVLAEVATRGRGGPVFLLHFHSLATAAVTDLVLGASFCRMTFLVQVDLVEHHERACIGVIGGRVGQQHPLTW